MPEAIQKVSCKVRASSIDLGIGTSTLTVGVIIAPFNYILT